MEFLPEFEVKQPSTISEAISLAGQETAVFLAGGTDLIPNLRRGIGECHKLRVIVPLNREK